MIGLKILSIIRRIYETLAEKYLERVFKVKIGRNFKVNGIISWLGSGTFDVGNDVKINSGKAYNPIGGGCRTILRTIDDGKIVIGNRVGISNSSIVAVSLVQIGDDVLIGGDCRIYDNDFHPIGFESRVENDRTKIKCEAVNIEKGAFIGAGTIILKGVTIGEKSVIGAGSVVTMSVPAGEIWAGNPARFIRRI